MPGLARASHSEVNSTIDSLRAVGVPAHLLGLIMLMAYSRLTEEEWDELRAELDDRDDDAA